MHLPEKTVKIYHHYNMLMFLIDESEQMKQLSKKNINELWSWSIIQPL